MTLSQLRTVTGGMYRIDRSLNNQLSCNVSYNARQSVCLSVVGVPDKMPLGQNAPRQNATGEKALLGQMPQTSECKRLRPIYIKRSTATENWH